MTCIRSHVQFVIWAGNVASSPESRAPEFGILYLFLFNYVKQTIFARPHGSSQQHSSGVAGRPRQNCGQSPGWSHLYTKSSSSLSSLGLLRGGGLQTSYSAGLILALSRYGSFYISEQTVETDYPWLVQRCRSQTATALRPFEGIGSWCGPK